MIKYLIHRPIAVTMIVIAIVVIGIMGIRGIPVSLMPDIDIPQITVQASASGYSTQEIENKVVKPLREQLGRVSGVKSIKSDSRMGMGSILLKFEPGSDIDLLFIEVNEKIDMVMGNLPKEMERPKVIKASATDIPAFYLDISFRSELAGLPATSQFTQLCDFSRNVVCRRLEQLKPTAMVDMSGLVSSEILCTPKADEMAALGMTVEDIQKALLEHDIQLSALSVTDGIYRYHVHFDSQLLTVDDVRNIYINHQGRLLQLKDLCDIEERPDIRKNILRHDGKNCVTLAIIKQHDAQMDDLKVAVDGVIADLQKDNPNLEFDLTRDQTELLSYSMNNLEWNLLAAILFTVIVLLYFMRKWKLAMLVALSIPLSLIITLLCFKLIGISLNIISLSGLILGVGMIVDNSIIVIDNIRQKMVAGKSLVEAVCKGPSEVFTPMLSSVLTTCSVFLPLIFIGGMAGALFFDQSMGITIALFASLLVSLVVLPIYYKVIFSKVQHRQDFSSGQCAKEITGTMEHKHMMGWYERTQAWLFNHIRLCLGVFLLSIPGTFGIFFLSEKRQMPEISYTDAIMYVDWNRSISIQENDTRVQDLMNHFKDQMETTTSMVGTQDFLLFHTRDISSSEALVYMKCQSNKDLEKVKKQMKKYLADRYVEASVSFSPAGNLFDMVFSNSEPDLCLKLQSQDGHRPEVLQSQAFVDTLRLHFPDVMIPSVVTEVNLQLVADVEQMSIYGISYQQLCEKLRQISGVKEILRINQGASVVPVVLGNTEADRQSILASSIQNAQGATIPLQYLLRERMVNDYKHLYGSDGGEFYPVNLNVSGKQARKVLDFVAHYNKLHPELRILPSGDYFDGHQVVVSLVWVLVVAILLLYFIMAAQFESLMQPMIILSEIVVDVFFVLLVLYVLGISIDLMSMTGIVIMAGIVINDSILKIDTINMHRRRGLELMEAIVKAGHERLMPIIMTSLTTIFSLLPFLAKGSIGADIQFPLSLAILVGMVVGTLVSIFFVPIVYYVIYRKK